MIAIITQARMNSSRLPGKIFLEAGGCTFLLHHVRRLQQSGLPVFVATTNNGSEDPIIEFCRQQRIKCYRGDENNVLMRYYECAAEHGITTIIRVTSDCPLIDGKMIAKGLEQYLKLEGDIFYSNTIQRTYPRGLDYEIFSFALLKDAYEKASSPGDLEHVTPYIWNNRSGKVKIIQDINREDNSDFRITLDTEEDRILLVKLIEEFEADKLEGNQITEILKSHPELTGINAHVSQKKST